MVNDANYTPLKVSTHNMNISGWKWVVPGNYNATTNNNGSNSNKPATTNKPATNANNNAKASVNAYVVKKGDTLGAIAYRMGWYNGNKMFGNNGYAQSLAEYNGIKNRGLIYPGQVVKKK
jgi:LysM repeat protein